ncbi:MAG TPA: GtrA family protein [Sphingomicrobium sp.]
MGLVRRVWSANTGWMLVRNTVVSTAVFLLGLGLLWLLVERRGTDTLVATAISFLIATTLHYALGRTWIFKGTERSVLPGYGFFLINAAIGLVVTVALMALLLALIPDRYYLVARVVVSVFAGLAMFLLNGILNFRRI